MLSVKKQKTNRPRKFTTPDGVIVTVTIGKPGETLFPEKLAQVNRTLSTLKNSPFTPRE